MESTKVCRNDCFGKVCSYGVVCYSERSKSAFEMLQFPGTWNLGLELASVVTWGNPVCGGDSSAMRSVARVAKHFVADVWRVELSACRKSCRMYCCTTPQCV